MAPITKFGVLAFASAVLAIPHAHRNHHRHGKEALAAPSYGESLAPVDPVSSIPAHASGSASYSARPTGWGTGYYGTGYGSASYTPTGWYPSVSPSASTDTSPAEISPATCGPSTSTCIWRDTTSVTTFGPTGYTPAPTPATETDPASACSPDTTVTEKVTQTITVTATPEASTTTGAPAVLAYDLTTSVALAAASYGAEKAGGWGWDSDTSAASATTDPAAPTYAPADATGAASAAPSYADASAAATTTASSPEPTATAGGSGSSGSKRGVAYNDVSAANALAGGNVGWAYNWVSNAGGFSGLPYYPTLHDGSSMFTSVWDSDVKAAISAGAQYIFSFNEPDMPTQANLSPTDAAGLWKQYIEPYAGQAKLVAPSVTNSQEPGQGLDWLSQFMSACTGCTIDAVNQHWYFYTSNDIDNFKTQVSNAASQSGKPVFVSEFGFIGSDSDISSSLEQVMGWMDSNDSVLGYAYYMASQGLLVNGDAPSAYGETYIS